MPYFNVSEAVITDFTEPTRYKEFQSLYVQMQFGDSNAWFLITEHDNCPPRLKTIKSFGEAYSIGDTIDFGFEIHSLPNRSNKLKIKKLVNHKKKT